MRNPIATDNIDEPVTAAPRPRVIGLPAPGTAVVVCHRRGDVVEHHLDLVRRTDRILGRVYLTGHGVFDRSGCGLSGPKGCLTLLAPTPDAFAEAVSGRVWFRERVVFIRPLSSAERRIAAEQGYADA